MNDVATEQRVYRERPRREEGQEQVSSQGNEEEEGEHGPLYGVRSRIRDGFHRTQEEASGMFDRVRRSFSDFINR